MSVFGDKRTLIAAARGDREAVTQVIRQSLPKVHGWIQDAADTIDRYRSEEWDADARRQEAYAGEVDPEVTLAAVNELYRRVLGVTHLIPLVLIAQGEEREVYEEKLGDNAYNLLLAIHNPTIRYAIIGGLDPEIREDADEIAEQISAEVWGTFLATTDSGDLKMDDFPEGTREVLAQIADELGDVGGAE